MEIYDTKFSSQNTIETSCANCDSIYSPHLNISVLAVHKQLSPWIILNFILWLTNYMRIVLRINTANWLKRHKFYVNKCEFRLKDRRFHELVQNWLECVSSVRWIRFTVQMNRQMNFANFPTFIWVPKRKSTY